MHMKHNDEQPIEAHMDHICIILSGLIDWLRWKNRMKCTWKEQQWYGFSYSYSAETSTISFHCSHMARRIIKLNMKPMSHGEEQIIREVSSVLTAAPLKRSCQLSAHCWENESWNIVHGDVWHMIARRSIFPSVCDIVHYILSYNEPFWCHSSSLNKITPSESPNATQYFDCLCASCGLIPFSLDCDSMVYILAKENCITAIFWCKPLKITTRNGR